MKRNINILKIFLVLLSTFFASKIFSQEWQANDISLNGHSIDFINANTGFVSITTVLNNVSTYKIFKTIDKGINFTQIYAQNHIPTGSYARLLIGSNATYVKDNNHYSISVILYT